MKPNPSPTPWRYGKIEEEPRLHLIWSENTHGNDILIARTCFAPASDVNAAHIVRCVNAAPSAIEALEDCVHWLDGDERLKCSVDTLNELLAKARAALAALKGEA